MTNPNDGVEQEAAGLLALARQMHEQHVQKGKDFAEEVMRNAQAEADRILREATETAHREIEQAQEELKQLQDRIHEHREFERQYRESLRDYLGALLANFVDGDDFIPQAKQEEPAAAPVATAAVVETAETTSWSEPVAAPTSYEVAADEKTETTYEVAPLEELAYEAPAPAEPYEVPEYEVPAPEFSWENTQPQVEPVAVEPVAPEHAYVDEPALTDDGQPDEAPIFDAYEAPAESAYEQSYAEPVYEGLSEEDLAGVIDDTAVDEAPLYEATTPGFEESNFESSVDPAGFDALLENAAAPEEPQAPSFEPFVPGVGAEDHEDVNKKLKGFFGRRKD